MTAWPRGYPSIVVTTQRLAFSCGSRRCWGACCGSCVHVLRFHEATPFSARARFCAVRFAEPVLAVTAVGNSYRPVPICFVPVQRQLWIVGIQKMVLLNRTMLNLSMDVRGLMGGRWQYRRGLHNRSGTVGQSGFKPFLRRVQFHFLVDPFNAQNCGRWPKLSLHHLFCLASIGSLNLSRRDLAVEPDSGFVGVVNGDDPRGRCKSGRSER